MVAAGEGLVSHDCFDEAIRETEGPWDALGALVIHLGDCTPIGVQNFPARTADHFEDGGRIRLDGQFVGEFTEKAQLGGVAAGFLVKGGVPDGGAQMGGNGEEQLFFILGEGVNIFSF